MTGWFVGTRTRTETKMIQINACPGSCPHEPQRLQECPAVSCEYKPERRREIENWFVRTRTRTGERGSIVFLEIANQRDSGIFQFPQPDSSEQGHYGKCKKIILHGLPELQMNDAHAGSGHAAGITILIQQHAAETDGRTTIKKICG